LKWFSLAARQNDAGAQYFLGLCYANGKGVPKDELAALVWFEVSAASGNASAVESRDLLERQLGPKITLEAKQHSKELLMQIERFNAATQ
jgi:TPR repeat protein